ncbi:hypothetical protein [Pedobacter sp. Leaf176]|uniref:hypothetical protein n=1 Tax=Pedobacter sp. Leaf176 TaxID=1736286 RepID=UPI0012F9242E|nr:hypothetical protein [Pedobacter sp. Leaf176]
MKLRQKLTRRHAKELLSQQEGVIYKSQFLPASHASGKRPSLLIQPADYIRLHHNRILNEDFVYKPRTDAMSSGFQLSLNGLSIRNL